MLYNNFAKILMLFFAASILYAQQKEYNVIIKVKADLKDSAKVFVAGNQKQLGNWNPSAVELKNTCSNIWRRSFSFPANTNLEFKFTKGSWSNEALTNNKIVPKNYKLIVENDTVIQIEINYWKENIEPEDIFKGQITGIVKYHKNLQWPGIKPRDIIVLLPHGYEENLNSRYPVLYMHDGQNIIDPKSSSFGIDWQIDEAVDTLIKTNKIEPIIVVGIYNT